MKFLVVFVLALAVGSSSAILPGLDGLGGLTGGVNGIVALLSGVLNAVLGLLSGGPGGLTGLTALLGTIFKALTGIIPSTVLPAPLGDVAQTVVDLLSGLLQTVLRVVLSLTNVLPLP